MRSVDEWNHRGQVRLPGHLGMIVTAVGSRPVEAGMQAREASMARNGFMHAGSLMSLADTCARRG